jgi:hypothetical protein
MPHRYNTNSFSSGQAEYPGDDMIVSLFCSISTANVANTIAHELGHNLRLRHGGNDGCNYKPNYNSVMNYKYQFPGVDTDCNPFGNGVLDYSRAARIDHDENALDENVGMCSSPVVPVDWNSNGTTNDTPLVYDLNSLDNSSCPGVLTVLRDYNDWAILYYAALSTSLYMPARIIDCNDRVPAPKPDER